LKPDAKGAKKGASAHIGGNIISALTQLAISGNLKSAKTEISAGRSAGFAFLGLVSPKNVRRLTAHHAPRNGGW
jgi:hypothetical protein